MIKSLYVHVPFCSHICYYCDFAKERYSQDTAEKYLDQLEKETDRIRQDCFDTVYIGGGTPSCLSESLLEMLFGILSRFKVIGEFTFEINPESMTMEKAVILKKYGVNRVSIGIQSFNEEILKEIGRVHDFKDVDNTFKYLDAVGITNRSIDLMYGFQHQSVKDLEEDIEKAVLLDVKHISIYELEVHENTVLGKRGYTNCDGDTSYLMYKTLMEKLESHGFHQYEISNFALEGYQSQHNKTYWHYEDYIGIGPGAAGKENHVRYENTHSLKKYLQGSCREEEIMLSIEDERFEYIMMGLRLLEGIDLNKYNKLFNCDINEHFREPLAKHLANGNLVVEKNYLKLSKNGIFVMNDILVDFMVWL